MEDTSYDKADLNVRQTGLEIDYSLRFGENGKHLSGDNFIQMFFVYPAVWKAVIFYMHGFYLLIILAKLFPLLGYRVSCLNSQRGYIMGWRAIY